MSRVPKFEDYVRRYRYWDKRDDQVTRKKVNAEIRRIGSALAKAAEALNDGATTTREARQQMTLAAADMGAKREQLVLSLDRLAHVLTAWSTVAAKSDPPNSRTTAAQMTAHELWEQEIDGPCSTSIDGWAVQELINIAHGAGDRSINKNAAKRALSATNPKRKAENRSKKHFD